MPDHREKAQSAKLDTISSQSLQRLLEISTRLSSTLYLDELLSLVMDVATELTDTEAASILLLDQNTGQLHFVASTGGQVLEDKAVPLDNSIAGWVVRNGRSLILQDVQADSRFYASVDQSTNFETKSMLAAPLVTNEEVIGALEVINKRDGATYTGQDVALMEALASQSAVAIMNARLFHQFDLLSEIMHELKTPLMAITAASELLNRSDVPPEKHDELIGMVQRESTRLSNMTQDFLDFARLESGRVRLAREPVDMAALVDEVVRIAQSQAASRHIVIDTDLSSGLPTADSTPVVCGDSDRLKQVLLNLVSNAIKYNVENGRVTVRAKVEETEIELSVADTGPGIAPQDLEHLFERFYRIPKDEKVVEGSGMGLTIAKKIVEEHDGRIEVESVAGEGTTFTVFLPLTTM